MSKITFRADDDLVEQIEALDASKSEVMREALREYLDRAGEESPATEARDGSLDALLAERVDELVAERLAERESRQRDRAQTNQRPQDVTVNVNLETDAPVRTSAESEVERGRVSDTERTDRRGAESTADAGKPRADAPEAISEDQSCGQCGESLSDDHVYCPNCGEKAARRVFCECGDEVRSDWGFCPSCGRRTPTADVLDRA
ncbi:double zinc ribbon domain-containing protein [Halorussus lipolyticus]|uniref:double zinc ribbon domain-containing protein n=1 Tax=Halorussus lipolyticus TaxID=3034024 RepID=UPI0023E85BB6|nr:zinc ribbon domain-containing protein [Halorussus sp. DT80]